MFPGLSEVPIIVYVLPAPVAPYANTVALYPSMMPSIKCFVVLLNISICPASLSNARSKAYCLSFDRFLLSSSFAFKISKGSLSTTIYTLNLFRLPFGRRFEQFQTDCLQSPFGLAVSIELPP